MAKQQIPNNKGEFKSSDVVKTAIISGLTFYNKPVQYSEVDGLAMFEGDIILGPVKELGLKTEMRKKEIRGEVEMGVLVEGPDVRWLNCIVPYTIDPNFTNQGRVTDAIAHWESNTRFRFVLRTDSNEGQYLDWINFQPSTGCSSYVGRQGGQQPINLANGCTTGNTIHEIGHAIGFWHEQSREDRDSFITINWDKIQPGREHNFNQHISDGEDVGNYDYDSIMHYPRTAFSIDGTDTITPTDPTATIGQRDGLSQGDIIAANSMCPRRICPVGPREMKCPTGPKEVVKCVSAPFPCRTGPHIPCYRAPFPCYRAPKIPCYRAPFPCYRAPFPCYRGPLPWCRVAPKPGGCFPGPRPFCPPSPRPFCPPSPRPFCPPSPLGCQAGPFMRPGPIRPGVYEPQGNWDYEPYAEEYYDPYGYESYHDYPGYQEGEMEDWGQHDPYYDPNRCRCNEPREPFDPRY